MMAWRALPHSVSAGSADYSKVDILGLWHKIVNFRIERENDARKRCVPCRSVMVSGRSGHLRVQGYELHNVNATTLCNSYHQPSGSEQTD